MNIQLYKKVEDYMLECMKDSAHDKQHIYRVLYMALDIAKYESDVDMEVLIISCLLHDIGREEQFKDSNLCHAKIGSENPSFFQEYKYKLEKLYDNFYTQRGTQLAKERKDSASAFYSSMLKEVQECQFKGLMELESILE